jgi:hypothetical protein
MNTMIEVLSWLMILLVASGFVWAIRVIVEAFYYQLILGPRYRRVLGFTEGSAYLQTYAHPLVPAAAVSIVGLAGDGIFARAGFRVGDVLPSVSYTSLFKMLHKHRGRWAELTVADGGKGCLVTERPTRIVRFQVPDVC